MTPKLHDEFMSMSRRNLTSCKHRIIQVRDRLSSMNIADEAEMMGEKPILSQAKSNSVNGREGKTMKQEHPKARREPQTVHASSSKQRPRASLMTQKSASFDERPPLDKASKQIPDRLAARRHSASCDQFSRNGSSRAISWPELPRLSAGNSPRRPKPGAREAFPRLAVCRRNSDPEMVDKVNGPGRSSSKSGDLGSEMGELYYGSLFRVLRHSMSAFSDRPRSNTDQVWRRSGNPNHETTTVQGRRLGLKPQPPSTPREMARSNTISPHQLELIHRNQRVLVERQLGRPPYFRSRTTTI